MKRKTLIVLALAACVATGTIVAAGSGAAGPAKKTAKVTVADDYFAPTAVKIRKGSKVKYIWSDANLDSHNVRLQKAPKGVDKKDFRSATGTIGINFAPKFKKPGKYHFVCTLHKSVMQMDVTVKK
jgi:plastocyanin